MVMKMVILARGDFRRHTSVEQDTSRTATGAPFYTAPGFEIGSRQPTLSEAVAGDRLRFLWLGSEGVDPRLRPMSG
jgi:hypothetical protein